jgi:hypothetical protein
LCMDNLYWVQLIIIKSACEVRSITLFNVEFGFFWVRDILVATSH